ncbi:MAG: electron transfer flavoprotein subunit alpha [Candidatus Cloacimonetes bacterium]|nr:electron transfer flavoprotein subunit alpha [Candidatus Cloacimonadota bacterium]
MIKVIQEKCIGCSKCIPICPYQAITLVDKKAAINLDTCTLCGACVPECLVDAIIIEKEQEQVQNLADYSGVMVYAEQKNGIVMPIAFEILSKARELADDLGNDVTAVLLGNNFDKQSEELIHFGADKVIVVDDAFLENFLDEPYTQAMSYVVNKYKPEIVLSGATAIGRSFIPRLAVELHTGLTADCTDLNIDPETKELVQTRPAFGGNIMAEIRTSNYRPQMATVRHKVFDPLPKDEKRIGDVIQEKVTFDNTKFLSKFLSYIKDETQSVKITDADIIVTGGRGIKCAENFTLIKQLASVLGAAVGASRAAVDSGWIEYSHQVGQTGKTVKPKIYIACGVSGAIQHLVGMQSSDIIIAINKDKDAPIFKVADVGIVGDLFEVIPQLVKQLSK